MNKLKTLLSIVLIALSTIALSSCDQDEITAYNLDGVWTGDINTSNSHIYSTFYFCKTGDTSGIGYERDQEGWISSSRTEFTWYIENGKIHMDYGREGIYVIDYGNLPNSSNTGEIFSGIFVDYKSGKEIATFDLTKKSNNSNDFEKYYYSQITTLDGVWTGYITDTNLEKTYSTFYFCKTGDTSGYGYERDQEGWISSSKTRFTWYIKNGNIYMDYGSEGIYVIDYDDLPNSSNIGETFSGIFVDYESGERTARFDLERESNNYNDFEKYYYSKKVEINADKDSVIVK